MLSSAGPAPSASALALNLGVTARTIERDISLLRRSGLAISATKGRSGGVTLGRERRQGVGESARFVALGAGKPDDGQTLESLSSGATRVALAAAVVGTTFERSLIPTALRAAGLDNLDSAEFAGQLVELLGKNVVARTLDREVLAFSSAELRARILRRALPAELERLNLAVGLELERMRAAGAPIAASRVAMHLIHSDDVEARRVAVRCAFDAGRESRRANDHADAVRWFKWIAELRDDLLDPASRLAAKIDLARSLAASSQRPTVLEAASLIREIVDQCMAEGQLELAAEVAQIECLSTSADSPHATDIARTIETVIRSPGLGRPKLGALLARHADAVLTERLDWQAAKSSLERSSAIAEELDDDRIRFRVQKARVGFEFKRGNQEGVIQLASLAIPRAVSLGESQPELTMRFRLATTLRLFGRLDEAAAAATEMLERARSLNIEGQAEGAGGILASIDMARGNFGLALEWAGKARERSGGTTWSVLPSAIVSVYDGTTSGFDPGPIVAGSRFVSRWMVALETAVLSLAIGYARPGAPQVRALRRLIKDFDESGGTAAAVAARRVLEPLLDSIEGNFARSKRWLEEHERWQNFFVGEFCGVPVATIGGLVAARSGESAVAARWLDLAIERCRLAGAIPQLACALVNRAAVDFTIGQIDRDDIRLIEAGQIARRLGIAPLLYRIAEMQGFTTDSDRQSDGPLTLREQEVLVLIARGRTTREIADTLFITESTVTRHTTNILEKIGARNRVEAAGYAYRYGFVE